MLVTEQRPRPRHRESSHEIDREDTVHIEQRTRIVGVVKSDPAIMWCAYKPGTAIQALVQFGISEALQPLQNVGFVVARR